MEKRPSESVQIVPYEGYRRESDEEHHPIILSDRSIQWSCVFVGSSFASRNAVEWTRVNWQCHTLFVKVDSCTMVSIGYVVLRQNAPFRH